MGVKERYNINQDISRYRAALMGICIIWVYFFHITVKSPMIDAITGLGWCGVDCFFFISAWGLSVSLDKNPSVIQFYKRRFFRIIPTWWMIIFGFHVINLIMHRPCPHTILQNILYYSGLGWWFNGYFEIEKIAWSEWYVPTLLFFYILTPFLCRLGKKTLLIILLFWLIACYFFDYYGFIESIKLSYPRFLSFVSGILFYKLLKDDRIGVAVPYILIIVSLVGFYLLRYVCDMGATTKHPASFLEMLGALMITPGFLYLCTIIIRTTKTNKFFSLFGRVSLELYLLHVFFISIAWNLRHLFPSFDFLMLCIALIIYLGMSLFINYVSNRLVIVFTKKA